MTALDLLPSWRDEFVLARDFRNSARRSDLAELIRRGKVVHTGRGVYRLATAVRPDDHDDAFLARIRGASLTMASPLPFAQHAAAAIWGLPLIGPAPERIVIASAMGQRGRSGRRLTHSVAGAPAPTEWRDGLAVTSLARTTVDVARTSSPSQAVSVCDAALRGQKQTRWRDRRDAVSREDLYSELAVFGHGKGTATARFAIGFADALSGSPGESVSRVGIHVLGFPPPELQVEFRDADGSIGFVDFWWPGCNLIGEFDGRGKYLREEYSNGRTAAEIVVDEKIREDRLRALGPDFSRWGWPVARSLPRLQRQLLAAGLK